MLLYNWKLLVFILGLNLVLLIYFKYLEFWLLWVYLVRIIIVMMVVIFIYRKFDIIIDLIFKDNFDLSDGLIL